MPKEKDSEFTPKKPLPRGIFLLPNLLTTGALFAAFYSIIAAVKGYFDVAAMTLFISMIADTLDGRVARMTNTQSAFGAQYDSLSDMVAFGLAPALLVYCWSLNHLGKLGWLAAFLYAVATALRLARFNTQAHDQDKQYFQGLPCTAAAPVLAAAVWLGFSYQLTDGMIIAVPVACLTILLAALMVSTIRYNSFKKIDFKGKISFLMLLIPVLVMVAIALEPPEMLFTIFFVYALSGPVMTLWQLRKIRRLAKAIKKKRNRLA